MRRCVDIEIRVCLRLLFNNCYVLKLNLCIYIYVYACWCCICLRISLQFYECMVPSNQVPSLFSQDPKGTRPGMNGMYPKNQVLLFPW